MSLNALRDDDIEAWQSFVWLGVLPDDAIATTPMASTLWGVEESEAADRLERLRNNELLLYSSPTQIKERTWPAYHLPQRLHDAARRLLLTPTIGLGIPLAQAHAELLKRYQVSTRSNLWHTLADDGYIHAHLAWHLEQAGWADEIHKLLREETSGHNGWYEACNRLGQTTIFVADVMLAWRLAEDMFEGSPSRSIALQCRYALIVSTLNGPSTSSQNRLSVALLQAQAEDSSQVLPYALQSLDAEAQASLLTEISDYLPQSLKEEALQKALTAIKAIQNNDEDDPECLDALECLVPKLPPELLPEALAIGGSISTGYIRALALKVLAPRLSPDLLLEAFDIARAFRGHNTEYCRALALSAVVDQLPERLQTGVLSDALAAARALRTDKFRDNVYCADALGTVANFLRGALRAEVLQEALDVARTIEEDWCRSIALSELAPKLSEALRAEVLQEALDAVAVEEEEWAKAQTLPVLVPELPPDLLPKALTVATGIQDKDDRAKALFGLTAKLPEVIPEAFAAVRDTQSEYTRILVLKALAPRLPPELLPGAFVIANDIQDECGRATVLVALASPMSKMQKSELFPLWQTILRSLSSQSQQDFLHSVLALAAVIYALGDQEAVEETLAAIQEVGRWWS